MIAFAYHSRRCRLAEFSDRVFLLLERLTEGVIREDREFVAVVPVDLQRGSWALFERLGVDRLAPGDEAVLTRWLRSPEVAKFLADREMDVSPLGRHAVLVDCQRRYVFACEQDLAQRVVVGGGELLRRWLEELLVDAGYEVELPIDEAAL